MAGTDEAREQLRTAQNETFANLKVTGIGSRARFKVSFHNAVNVKFSHSSYFCGFLAGC